MVDEKIIEAFYMMWDNFPGIVRLIHKNRTVLAANEVARSKGFEVGVQCNKVGTPEDHKGCRAHLALSTKTGQAVKSGEGKVRYWLPVKGSDEVYVHFTVDTNTAE
jgi:hypothetical protein